MFRLSGVISQIISIPLRFRDRYGFREERLFFR